MINGTSVISYTLNNVPYTEPIKDAFTRITQYSDAIYGNYDNPETNRLICNGNVKILDHMSGDYVEAYSIRKEFRNEFYDMVFNEGRYVSISTDHKVNTNNRGDIDASTVEPGDTMNNMISSAPGYKYRDSNIAFDFAWLLGVLFVSGEYRNNLSVTLYKNDTVLNAFIQSRMDYCNGIGNSGNVEKQPSSARYHVSKGKNPKSTILTTENKFTYNSPIKNQLASLFGALNKSERKVPQMNTSNGRYAITSFVSGVIDAIGVLKNISENKYDVELTVPSQVAQELFYLLMSIDIPATIEYGTTKNGSPSGKDTISFAVCYEMQKFSHSSLYDKKLVQDQDRWSNRCDKALTVKKMVRSLLNDERDVYDIDTSSGYYTVNGIQMKSDRVK